MNIFVGLKIWVGHGSTEKYGNAVITNISSEINNPINVFHIISLTIPKNGGTINLMENKIHPKTIDHNKLL